jgi:hypothetical protein
MPHYKQIYTFKSKIFLTFFCIEAVFNDKWAYTLPMPQHSVAVFLGVNSMKVTYIVEVVTGKPFVANERRLEFTSLTNALKAVNLLIKRGCHIQMFASNADGFAI